MSEEPTTTAEFEETQAPQESATPEPPSPQEDAPPDQTPVEPRLGLGDFAAVAGLDTVTQAGLRTWMRTKGYRPDGHYPLAEWQEYRERLMKYTG